MVLECILYRSMDKDHTLQMEVLVDLSLIQDFLLFQGKDCCRAFSFLQKVYHQQNQSFQVFFWQNRFHQEYLIEQHLSSMEKLRWIYQYNRQKNLCTQSKSQESKSMVILLILRIKGKIFSFYIPFLSILLFVFRLVYLQP